MLIDISQICVYYIKWREDIDRCTRVTRVSRSVNLVVDLLAVLSCRHDGKDSITWHTLPETTLRKINMEQWLNNYHKKIKTELAQKDARLVEWTENMVDNQLDIPSNLKTTQLMIEKEHLPSASMTWCCLAVVMFQVFFFQQKLWRSVASEMNLSFWKSIFSGETWHHWSSHDGIGSADGACEKSHQHLAPVFLNAWICHVFSFLPFFGLGISRGLTMPEMACQKKSKHFYRSPWVLTRSGGQNVSYGQQIGELNLAKRVTQKDGRCLSERVPWTKLLLEHFMRLMPPLKRWWMDEKCKYILHIYTHTHIHIYIYSMLLWHTI